MKSKILLGIAFVMMWFTLLFAQTNDLTKSDLFGFGGHINSSDVSISGISLKTKISELLRNFHKSKSDLEQRNPSVSFLELTKGIAVASIDKNTISEIIIRNTAREMFEGETKKYFDLKNYDDFSSFLNNKFGKPNFISHKNSSSSETASFFYSNGFYFTFMNLPLLELIVINIRIVQEEKVEQIAIEAGAKSPEEIYKIESTPIPLSTSGFRQALWGMSKEQVRTKEAAIFQSESRGDGGTAGLEMLVFNSNINGLNCAIVYYFANNRLTRARYILADTHINQNTYIEDYNEMKIGLTAKYGTPSRDQLLWTNNLYKDNPDEYGMAISAGHLKYVSEWNSEETTVQLLLRGEKFQITLWAEYIGKAFELYEKKVMDKAKKDIW